MAQSIRISDALYQLALAHSAAMGRSLAQQVDYWARLGAALEEAGMTVEQALGLLGRSEGRGRGAFIGVAEPEVGDSAPRVRRKQQDFEREVRQGQRDARSLVVIPGWLAREAAVTLPKAKRPRKAGEEEGRGGHPGGRFARPAGCCG
jgi:hypothetical protein